MEENVTVDPATQVDPNVDPTATDTKVETPDVVDKTDTTPVDDGIMGEKAAAKAEETPKGAPEKYELFTIAEGFEISEEAHAEISALGKDLGLTQEGMQKLVDYNTESQKKQGVVDKEAQEKAAVEADKKEIAAWHEESRKEHGDKYSEVIGTAKKVWDSTLMPAETRTLLSVTNLNHNPHILNLLNNIGKSMSEDTFVPAGQKVKGKNEDGIKGMFSDLNNKK